MCVTCGCDSQRPHSRGETLAWMNSTSAHPQARHGEAPPGNARWIEEEKAEHGQHEQQAELSKSSHMHRKLADGGRGKQRDNRLREKRSGLP